MNYKFSSNEIEFTNNADGTVEFRHNGTLYRTVEPPVFGNSPSDNYSAYVAALVCPEDAEYPNDHVGQVRWDIIDADCDDESNACDWDKFDVYLD